LITNSNTNEWQLTVKQHGFFIDGARKKLANKVQVYTVENERAKL